MSSSSSSSSSPLSLWACWTILFLCIVAEVTGTVCMKLSNNYKHIVPSIVMFLCYFMAIGLFPYALARIELGIAYAVWSGAGTSLTVYIGIQVFHEKSTSLKMLGILLVIVGIILLNFDEEDFEESSHQQQQTITTNDNDGMIAGPKGDASTNISNEETSLLG